MWWYGLCNGIQIKNMTDKKRWVWMEALVSSYIKCSLYIIEKWMWMEELKYERERDIKTELSKKHNYCLSKSVSLVK